MNLFSLYANPFRVLDLAQYFVEDILSFFIFASMA